MLVSVFADASFDPETRAGGFGYWSKSLRGQHSGGGPFKSLARNSGIAEMMACLNALHMTFVHLIAWPGDTILIQTDCTAAIAAFERKRILQEDERIIVDGLVALLQIKNATVRWKHVKGHTNGEQPRLWVNNQCDHLAKMGMREARAQARVEPLPELFTRPKRPKPSADECSKKRESRKADRMLDQNNRRTFAFGFNEEEWNNYVMDPRLSSIPPWEEQEPAEQLVARVGMGIPDLA
jgi:ribonuclease HI